MWSCITFIFIFLSTPPCLPEMMYLPSPQWPTPILHFLPSVIWLGAGGHFITIFIQNSNSVKNLWNYVNGNHITSNLSTWHDSLAVVPCAKFWSDYFIGIWKKHLWNFHRIWITLEKSLVKCTARLVSPGVNTVKLEQARLKVEDNSFKCVFFRDNLCVWIQISLNMLILCVCGNLRNTFCIVYIFSRHATLKFIESSSDYPHFTMSV